MARYVRKNLIVDAAALRQLANERGTSESQAVRDAVDIALGRFGMVAALEALRDMGAFADFETLFPPLDAEPQTEEAPRPAKPRRRKAKE